VHKLINYLNALIRKIEQAVLAMRSNLYVIILLFFSLFSKIPFASIYVLQYFCSFSDQRFITKTYDQYINDMDFSSPFLPHPTCHQSKRNRLGCFEEC
jgi:hypothetical protein